METTKYIKLKLKQLKKKYNESRENARARSLTNKQEELQKYVRMKKIIILSSDCVGGRLQKDYKMPCYTPTINNWYSADDFIKICLNPDYYFSQEVIFKGYDFENHPVGLIDDVEIHFGHCDSYEEGLAKWKIGCKSYFRATKNDNYEICVIQNDRNGFSEEHVDKFEALPYENKVLFVHKRSMKSKNSFYMKNEDKRDCVDTMTRFENWLTIRRRYDRFDFFEWFKNMYVKEND